MSEQTKPKPIELFNANMLHQAVRRYVNMQNCDQHGKAIITDAVRVSQICDSLTRRMVTSFDKYLRGQLEHGGDICERDLMAEIRQEIEDLGWYVEAVTWKEKGYVKSPFDTESK